MLSKFIKTIKFNFLNSKYILYNKLRLTVNILYIYKI